MHYNFKFVIWLRAICANFLHGFLQAIIENTQNHQSLANFNHYNRLLLQIIQCQMAGNCKYHCINLLRVFIYEDFVCTRKMISCKDYHKKPL